MEFRHFLYWLSEWYGHRRRVQCRILAAVLAAVYCQIEESGRQPRQAVERLLVSGFLSDQLVELLRQAVDELDNLALDFERHEQRPPKASELEYWAREDALEELRKEFNSWDLPF